MKMPKNVSADKSLRRENQHKKKKNGMIVDGASAKLKRVNQIGKKRCPNCGKQKNKKARLCKDCLANPIQAQEKKNDK